MATATSDGAVRVWDMKLASGASRKTVDGGKEAAAGKQGSREGSASNFEPYFGRNIITQCPKLI